jgi:hypothetical protein
MSSLGHGHGRLCWMAYTMGAGRRRGTSLATRRYPETRQVAKSLSRAIGYQRFLHERNRGKKDCDGRPDREPEEIARWAREHELPYEDGHVHFPDARIEYEDRDGRSRHDDLEIVTGH